MKTPHANVDNIQLVEHAVHHDLSFITVLVVQKLCFLCCRQTDKNSTNIGSISEVLNSFFAHS